MPVRTGLHPFVQILEILLEFLPVLLLGDIIHAHRRVVSDAAVGLFEHLQVKQVRQRIEPQVLHQSP